MQLHQRLAFKTIAAMRKAFDLATGYRPDHMNETRWLRRIIFLESVAGVPGMVSANPSLQGHCVTVFCLFKWAAPTAQPLSRPVAATSVRSNRSMSLGCIVRVSQVCKHHLLM